MKILFPIAECEPFAKTGGLGDVGSALPLELFKKKVDIRVVMPFYRKVQNFFDSQTELSLKTVLTDKEISFDKFYLGMKKVYSFNVYQSKISSQSDAIIYFIDIPEFFDRPNLYVGADGKAYPDSVEIYGYFTKSIFEFLNYINWSPDIIHAHDWHTGLVPLFIKHSIVKSPKPVKTIFTIHNMAYQGIFPLITAEKFGLNSNEHLMNDIVKDKKLNFLKAGIVSSDIVTTVSETYRDELMTAEFGNGLEDSLREKKEKFFGILNGVDYEIWNPETDKYLARNYSASDVQGKKECKNELWKIIQKYNSKIKKIDPSVPIFSIVSRLDKQKGIDILIEIIPELSNENMHLVMVGSGNKKYEDKLHVFNKQTNFTFIAEFSNTLVHQIESGSDFFLMPSRYEPCGLNQMYSLRYGTFPIVRKTGGLADTVKDINNDIDGNGFVFSEYDSQELKKAIKRSISFYEKTENENLDKLRSKIMKKNLSWETSIVKYIELYKKLIHDFS